MVTRTYHLNIVCKVNSQRVIRQGPPLILSRPSSRSFYDHVHNRAQEIEQLSTQLKRPPRFSVWLGPSDSGKITLARQLTAQTRSDGTREFNSLIIDLRSVDHTQPDGLRDVFIRYGQRAGDRGDPLWERIFNRSGTKAGGFWKRHSKRSGSAAGGLSLGCDLSIPPVYTLTRFLNDLGNKMEPWSPSTMVRPVLIIDQADELRWMDKDMVYMLLHFVGRITHTVPKMHVIFITSDSLFLDWMAPRIKSTRFKTIVVGDLSREEANNYFQHAVENNSRLSEETKDLLLSMDFGIVYKMTGGRMVFIRSYIKQVHEFGHFVDPQRFGPVQLEHSLLLRELSREAKTYGKKEVLIVFRILLNSPGYVSYDRLVEGLGLGVVQEMLERNLIFYRPRSLFAKDLLPPPSESVVTPPSQPALCAMEWLIKEMGPM
ncbi:hypothetical protein PSTG_14144 [Puccinia striiformis f. sp. tritici PST-78]|uniref:Uncharacterized protein n=1 Tax=Puccinia striiformis f. sp. tritici PST-78 TaxID=1165861 RepID=A0A0L0UZF3_9BASI|nr:hypothetical protein PSTG_14144 [Puccinia striiformis f. sp. tritici PST-78]